MARSAFNIVRLGPDDIARLDRMLDLFSSVFEDPESYSSRRPGCEYQRKLLGSPGFFALVAMDADRVIGGLAAYELVKFEQERSEIYIYDLAVDTAYRRRGVATALIRELGDLAKACGAWVMFVQADHGDNPAIALYTKLGIREDVLHFDLAMGCSGLETRNGGR